MKFLMMKRSCLKKRLILEQHRSSSIELLVDDSQLVVVDLTISSLSLGAPMGTFSSSSSRQSLGTYGPTCSTSSSPILRSLPAIPSFNKDMQPSDEPSSNERSNDEAYSDEKSNDELSPYVQHSDGPSPNVQHSDGPSVDGDPSPSNDIQFSDDRFCSKLSMLDDDDDDDDDDPTTSLLPSFPKWAIATLTNVVNFLAWALTIKVTLIMGLILVSPPT
jgi:hypothetical protein